MQGARFGRLGHVHYKVLGARYRVLEPGTRKLRGFWVQGTRFWRPGHVNYVIRPGYEDLEPEARNSHGFRLRLRGFGSKPRDIPRLGRGGG